MENKKAEMEEALRKKAKDILEKGEVKVVIGYGWNRLKTHTTPVFITKTEDAERLVWNPLCVNNLSIYLTRKFKNIQGLGRPAIVAKGCDIKNIVVLITEAQLKREDVHIIGMTCNGVAYKQELWKGELRPEIMPAKCHNCDVRNPHVADTVIGEPTAFIPPEKPAGMVFDRIKGIDSKTSADKWEFWLNEFSRCIKCYACRQVCSLCYCERCITEKNMPQWIETSAHPRGNLSWNLTRAMHLVGRCTFCGECERACPVNIPLNLVNQKMIQVVKDSFGFSSGLDTAVHPPMIVFSPDDKENFIK
ncbi:MAG: 4Fe-4S dicluster domain-containing protein [Deltaproteobacteria bacterium]|nr:4Fe-4S dicluster domain-containing protein [Deltaproteobacteria bacterium]